MTDLSSFGGVVGQVAPAPPAPPRARSAPPAPPAPLRGGTAGRAVVVHDLRRSFGEREVLRGIDLEIHRGEFVALLGRSGSGKSTILRALAGLDDGVEGELLVPERRAVVFQDPRLLPWADVLANVVLGQRGRDARDRGSEALGEVGLAGHEHDWPKTLSGGEAQRVALARALVRKPDLLLLDEPFGALDALTRIRMHGLVAQLCARHHPAVLLVTHDVDEAILLADRVLVLTDGRITLDLAVGDDGARDRAHPQFAELRTALLAEIGVVEAGPGSGGSPDPAPVSYPPSPPTSPTSPTSPTTKESPP